MRTTGSSGKLFSSYPVTMKVQPVWQTGKQILNEFHQTLSGKHFLANVSFFFPVMLSGFCRTGWRLNSVVNSSQRSIWMVLCGPCPSPTRCRRAESSRIKSKLLLRLDHTQCCPQRQKSNIFPRNHEKSGDLLDQITGFYLNVPKMQIEFLSLRVVEQMINITVMKVSSGCFPGIPRPSDFKQSVPSGAVL